MFIEERDYRTKPGKASEFISIYESEGLEIQKELLGTFLGYFTTEVGELNHVVAWWSYESLDDRQDRRDKMMQDPRWQNYLNKVTHLLDTQNTRILRPVAFSPIQ